MITKPILTIGTEVQHQTMQRYYRWQSRIYDLTRWTFLYGRDSILEHIPFEYDRALDILEVGCGTGKNLVALSQKYPKAWLIGMDVSGDMIEKARQKNYNSNQIILMQKPYQAYPELKEGFDLIIFSYALTMINPQWEELILQAKKDLRVGGCILVVDFHDSRFGLFKLNMQKNHVKMDSHLLPVLQREFKPHYEKVRSAYGGVWEYVQFIGIKK